MTKISGDICDSLRIKNLHKSELILKFVFIGNFGVGEFSPNYKCTIGVDFAVKVLEWDQNTRVILHLWDVAGYERFGDLTSVFYRHALGAAVVFDLTRPETFDSVIKWVSDIRRKVGKKVPIILLANKGDITTNTVPSEINEFCKNNDIFAWLVTSAKDNIHIDDAMIKLTKAALDYNRAVPILNLDENTVRLDSNNEKIEKEKDWKCCPI